LVDGSLPIRLASDYTLKGLAALLLGGSGFGLALTIGVDPTKGLLVYIAVASVFILLTGLPGALMLFRARLPSNVRRVASATSARRITAGWWRLDLFQAGMFAAGFALGGSSLLALFATFATGAGLGWLIVGALIYRSDSRSGTILVGDPT
jgi:hypothetical protein